MNLWPLLLLPLGFLYWLSVSWTHSRGAPWVPTSMSETRRMLAMAGVGPEDVVYDLGCGDGRLIVTAAREYGARAVGIELDPLRYLWCQLLITVLGLRGQVRVLFGDFFYEDLSGADVVTCYLLPSTNEKLEGKLLQELQPNARIISHDFIFPNLRLVQSEHKEEDELYLYRHW